MLGEPSRDRKPAIVVVDSDADQLAWLEEELQRRYAEDYRIIAKRSTTSALTTASAAPALLALLLWCFRRRRSRAFGRRSNLGRRCRLLTGLRRRCCWILFSHGLSSQNFSPPSRAASARALMRP